MTLEELKIIICENFGVSADEVTPEAKLQDDLGLDSLDAVELSIILEEKHGVSIPEEEFAQCKVVGDILNFANGQ